MKVYLSSTLDDLREERAAVKDVLGGEAIVRDSYRAHEKDLKESCLADVAECELYIGIVGLRYGYIPPGEARSITHLEYDEAGRRKLSRLVFLKGDSAIPITATDVRTKEHPPDLIDAFRAQISSGAAGEARPAIFSTLDELKLAVQRAVSDYRSRKAGAISLMRGRVVHPWEVRFELSIAIVPGTDETLKDTIDRCARGDQRVHTFILSPATEMDYLARLDEQVRRSRAVLVAVTPASLPRIEDGLATVVPALATVTERRAAHLALVTAGVPSGSLPTALAALLPDVFETASGDWDAVTAGATFERLRRWCRERVPPAPERPQIGVPHLTVALTLGEALELRDSPDAMFARFGDAAPLRRSGFERLGQSLAAAGLPWPDAFYGAAREAWRPFGADTPSIQSFVESAARKVNTAPEGSRERRVLRDAMLTAHRYRFDKYLTDVGGSRENLRRVCESGCLVLVDEFALLHPDLRPALDTLLVSNNAAVVSLSACDPAPSPLCSLLGDLSYLRVGNLLSRFQQVEDVRCELALNSVERLQRWLRLVLPELMTTLAQQQSDPDLVRRVDALFV